MGNNDGNETLLGKEARDSETMSPEDWETLLQRNREAQAEHSKASTAKARATLQRLNKNNLETDIADRRERRELYGDPGKTLRPNEPESSTVTRSPSAAGPLTAAQRQVRTMYEQQIPELPPEVQRRWDGYVDARCKEMIESALGNLADFLGEEFGKFDVQLDDLRKKHVDEIAKLKKEFNAKIVKMRKETGSRGSNIVDLPNPLVRKA
jgi:hypothetical protein